MKRTLKLQALAMTLGLLAAVSWTSNASATAAEPRETSNPSLRSKAFYIVDATDSTVLAAHNEQVAAPIASISKLMTALVVLDAAQPMDEKITITRDDAKETAKSGSRLTPGMQFSRADLLHLALMSSENRAAHALCRSYPGGTAACVSAMNEKAKALDMPSAHFVEPTGLSSDNVSSAVDLAKLVQAAAANPTIREYSTDPEHTFYVRGRPMQFRSTNSLTKKADWQVTVQKTGYISEAGRCLVMQTIINGRDVVIVLLNSWGKLTRVADASRVRNWVETHHPYPGG